ncbi:MAG: GFA family protein [Oligoflexales bacterium]
MQKYTGGCHCGKVSFEIEAEIEKVMSCNCSICSKRGYLLTFVPAAKFKLLKGADVLSDYQFNKKVVHHKFCKNCGVGSFGQGTAPNGEATYAINVRCVEGIELDKLTVKQVDGKKL